MHRRRSLPKPRSRAAMVAALALSLGASSCAERPPREGPSPEREGFPATRAAARQSEATPVETATATRGFLIYSVQWGKAEDLALTLEPIVQARYGPAARVVPHVPTNKLFIYLPSPREQEAGGFPSAQGVPRAGVPQQGAPRAQRTPSQGLPSAGRRASTGGRTR